MLIYISMNEGIGSGPSRETGSNDKFNDIGMYVGDKKKEPDTAFAVIWKGESAVLDKLREFSTRIANRTSEHLTIPDFEKLSIKEKMEAMYELAERFVSEYEFARYVYHNKVAKKANRSQSEENSLLDPEMQELFAYRNYELNPHGLGVELSVMTSADSDAPLPQPEELRQLHQKIQTIGNQIQKIYQRLETLFGDQVEREYDAER